LATLPEHIQFRFRAVDICVRWFARLCEVTYGSLLWSSLLV